jgi:hypothetical protein
MKHHAFPIFAAMAVVLFFGCGRKTQEAPDRTSDFDHPSEQMLQSIAQQQGWKIESVEAQNRAFKALEAGRQPTDADWRQLVAAADSEKNGFDLSLAMEFSRHITDKYRPSVLKWCERNMEQTQDPDAAVIGYACYVRSGGRDRELWAARLKARGQFYADKIAETDRRAAARK